MPVQAIAFYLLAFVTIAAGLLVVSARNPVHSVLFLITAFFSAAVMFLAMAAEIAPGGGAKAQRHFGGHRMGIGAAPHAVSSEKFPAHAHLRVTARQRAMPCLVCATSWTR